MLVHAKGKKYDGAFCYALCESKNKDGSEFVFIPGNPHWEDVHPVEAGRVTADHAADPVTCPKCVLIQFKADLFANATPLITSTYRTPDEQARIDASAVNIMDPLPGERGHPNHVHIHLDGCIPHAAQDEWLRNLGHALTVLGPLKRGFSNTPGRKWLGHGRSISDPPLGRHATHERDPRLQWGEDCVVPAALGIADKDVAYVHPRNHKDPVDDPSGEDVAE